MGIDSKLSEQLIGKVSPRKGIALPGVLFGLVAVSVMAAAVFSMSDLQSKSVKNRESSARAHMLAEAGMVHAITVLRDDLRRKEAKELFWGSDETPETEDDGLIIGYGLTEAAQIPAIGKDIAEGNYKVTITDDPADTDGSPLTDSNFRFLINCTGETPDGAKATLSAVVGSAMFPGVVTEGNLTINGNPEMVGKCGGAHANAVAIVSGNPVVSGPLSATQIVVLSGTVEDTSGNTVTPLQWQPPKEIPDIKPADYCATAEYTLKPDGTVTQKSTGATFNISSNPKFGWKMASGPPEVVFDHDANTATDGTVCALGNVKVGGSPGSADSPLAMSIIATGSIQISGNPYFAHSSEDGIMFLAGGDVEVAGNPHAAELNYDGLIYSTSQCKINGNPTISGQIVCKDKPNPTNTKELAVKNEISGNPVISYDCGGFLLNRRRVLYWYQTGS